MAAAVEAPAVEGLAGPQMVGEGLGEDGVADEDGVVDLLAVGAALPLAVVLLAMPQRLAGPGVEGPQVVPHAALLVLRAEQEKGVRGVAEVEDVLDGGEVDGSAPQGATIRGGAGDEEGLLLEQGGEPGAADGLLAERVALDEADAAAADGDGGVEQGA